MGVQQSVAADFGTTSEPLHSSLNTVGGRSGEDVTSKGETPYRQKWSDQAARGQGRGAGVQAKDRYIDATDQAAPRRPIASVENAHFTPETFWDEIEKRGYTNTHTRPTGGNGEFGIDQPVTSGRNAYEQREVESINGRTDRE